MLRLTLALTLALTSIFAAAQNYDQSLGLRVGLSQGLTYKQFVNRDFAVEAMALVKDRSYNLTAIAEKHDMFLDTRGLQWYYGLGGHVDIVQPVNSEATSKKFAFYPGLDAILGFEYSLRRYPFSVSVDWKPSMMVQQGAGDLRNEGALSVRYTW